MLATASPTTFREVTSISMGRLMARMREYASRALSFTKPAPDRMVKRMTAPAPGAAGVPTEASRASRATTTSWAGVTV